MSSLCALQVLSVHHVHFHRRTRERTPVVAMDVDAFVAASDAYPIPTSPDGAPIHFSYGTAGFRTIGDVLASTVFRCGAVAAIRSSVTGRATGMVVTASHNPERDNGVKLVDCDGGMLPVAWERHAEAIANAPTHDALRAAIELAQTPAEAHLPQHNHPPPHAPTPPPPHVFLARDTRPTGPTLAAAAKAGAEAIGAQVTDCGLMTTPQLHYVVYASYRNHPCDESDYFARLARGFGNMVQGVAGGTHDASTIVVDCANGVGAAKLAPLRTALGTECVLTLDPRNYKYGRPGSLNNEVGADFVQKEKTCPMHGGFDGVGADARCVSVDGDADRLVYFRKINTARKGESDESNDDSQVELFDGDKIAALMATRVADLLKRCAPNAFDPPLRVGVVQTAYANGASTAYVRDTLGLEVACTATGVKFLHPEAEKFDVGVYFEANGHGTAVFSDQTLSRLDDAIARASSDEGDGEESDQCAALKEMKAMTEAINPAVGDALSGILVVEAILLAKGWGLDEWGEMYADLPSKQVKVMVKDRAVITTTNAERIAVTPNGEFIFVCARAIRVTDTCILCIQGCKRRSTRRLPSMGRTRGLSRGRVGRRMS